MTLQLVSTAVVVAARQFNPSIVREYWLVSNGLLAPDELEKGSVFSDLLVQVKSPSFQLLVSPDKVQFSPKVPAENEQTLIVEKVGSLTALLPHTPYSGLGLNFYWHLMPQQRSVEDLCRKLFFAGESPLHQEFQAQDARFGGYMSKNVLDFRLKLEVKPLKQTNEDEERHYIHMSFNFHRDISRKREEAVAEIQDSLNKWNELRAIASHISDMAASGDA